MVELSSDAAVIQTRIMPPINPLAISGTVKKTKVRSGDTPRLIEASSRTGLDLMHDGRR